jgi:hypothetical protein
MGKNNIVPEHIRASAQALQTYLSIRGLNDGEIERSFIRFEECISAHLIAKITEAVKDLPPLLDMPEETIPSYELLDEFNQPTGTVAAEQIVKPKRLTNRSDILLVIESFKPKDTVGA